MLKSWLLYVVLVLYMYAAPHLRPPRPSHAQTLMDKRVEIHGTSRADINGKHGVAIDFHPMDTGDPTTWRYTVKLDGGEAFKLKPANVRAEDPGAVEEAQINMVGWAAAGLGDCGLGWGGWAGGWVYGERGGAERGEFASLRARVPQPPPPPRPYPCSVLDSRLCHHR